MSSSRFQPAAMAALGASLIAVLAGSLVTARLPSMSCSVHADPSRAPLIVSAYLAAAGLGLPLGGFLGDATGRARLIGGGAALLAIGSGVCALAPSLAVLLVGRVAQGIATALILPNAVAVIGTLADASTATHRLPTYSAACTLATLAGPVLGGFAPGCGGWRRLFIVTALGGVGAMFAIRRCVGRNSAADARPAATRRPGWRPHARTLVAPPMVALNIFTVLFFGAALSLLPLLSLGLAASGTPAAAFLSISLGPVVLAPLTARLQRRVAAATLLLLAAVSLALAVAAFALAAPGGSYLAVLSGALLTAFAFALVSGPLSAALLTATAATSAGLAAGVNSAAARLGGAAATMLLAPAFAQRLAGFQAYRGALSFELLLAGLAVAAALAFRLLTRRSDGSDPLPLSRLQGPHHAPAAS